MHRRRDVAAATPDYQRLYDDTRTSLVHLADAQSAALGRVERLRHGIVTCCKQHYPHAVADAETRLGRPLANADDDILLAYFANILATPPTVTAARTAAANKPLWQLRQALTKAGYTLPDTDDISAWAERINATHSPAAANATPAAGAATPEPSRDVHLDAGREEPDLVYYDDLDIPDDAYEYAPIDPSTTADLGAAGKPDPDEAADLADLFTDDHQPEGHELADLSTLFTDEHTSTTNHINGADTGTDGHGSHPHGEPAGPEDTSGANLHVRPRRTRTSATRQNEAPGTPEHTRHHSAPHSAESTNTVSENVPVHAANTPPTPANGPAQSVPDTATATPSQLPLPGAPGQKLRPQLITTKKAAAPKSVRTTRRAAAAPSTFDAAAISELVAGMLKSPKPVYAADIVAAGADVADVAAYIEHARTTSSAGIRVLGAKNHHRRFGDLLIPDGDLLKTVSDKWHTSAWGRVVTGMLGARVYETGLILHKYPATDTVTFNERIVTVDAVNDNGSHGVIITTETKLPAASTGLHSVADAVETYLARPVTSIAVLTTATTRRACETIAEDVRAEGLARDWTVTVPIITSRPVDYVTDSGAAAISTLG